MPITLTKNFRAWEEWWEKFNSIVHSAGDEKFVARPSAKYDDFLCYDPGSRKQMHSAKGDCTVLIKLDENSERKQEIHWILDSVLIIAAFPVSLLKSLHQIKLGNSQEQAVHRSCDHIVFAR